MSSSWQSLLPLVELKPWYWGCLVTDCSFFCLDLVSVHSLQSSNHSFLSRQSSYHLSLTSKVFTCDHAASLHLIFVPWYSLSLFNSLSSTFLRSLDFVHATRRANHLRHCSVTKSDNNCCIPKVDARCLLVFLSFHCWSLVTPRIVLCSGSKRSSDASLCLAVNTQVAASHRRTAGNTTAWYGLSVLWQ